ncbi:MAG: PRC-barrel domain-containing protein [Caloramator sp.]|nr:PRC-barrel domain-containing protein [Caloramator sp.]
MKRYVDVKGSRVVDDKGNLIGIIEDCLIDLKKLKVCSYIVRIKNLHSDFCLIILKDLDEYKDVFILKGNMYKIDYHIFKRHGDMLIKKYIGMETIDAKGEWIGILKDLIFDETDGSIKALICKIGFFEDILDGRRVIIVDEKTIFEKERIVVYENYIDITNSVSLKKIIR